MHFFRFEGFPFYQFCIPIYSEHVDYSTIRWNNELNDTFRQNIIAKQPVFNTISNNIVFDSRKDVSDCICKLPMLWNKLLNLFFPMSLLWKINHIYTKVEVKRQNGLTINDM